MHGALECHLDATWSDLDIKRAAFNRSGISLAALRQRLDVRA